MVPIILYSDKTRLTVIGGDKSAWPVYMTLGNIEKGHRNQLTFHCWVPIAYLPVPKWDMDVDELNGILTARFFHQALSVVMDPLISAAKNGTEMMDSLGDVRMCYPRIAAYMSDLLEACLNMAITTSRSPVFNITTSQFGDTDPGPLLTYDVLMDEIEELQEEYGGDDPTAIAACLKEAKTRGLNGVLHPWWENHVGFEPW